MQHLSQVAVESVVKLNENGAAVNYVVVHQGKPSSIYDDSCDGTWILRQDIAENRVWDSGSSNVLESSDVHSYLNNTWINRYDTDIRNAIKQVKIPYRQNGGSSGADLNGANGLSCKIFLLSGREVGFTNNESPYFPNDGAKLDYFISGSTFSAQKKRIAKLNGSDARWWLRSPYTGNGVCVWSCGFGGHHYEWDASDSYGVRPALVLPSTLLVSDDGSIKTNTAPTAPGNLTIPDQANKGGNVAVSWSASTDQDGNLSGYTLQRSVNGGGFTQVYQGANTSYTDTAPTNADTLQYRVQAYDTEGATSGWTTSDQFPVYGVPALTVPPLAMQGQSIAVNWTAITGADSYTLQRKANTDSDWVQVYSGTALTFSETAGTWTTVQYRVQAVFDETPGGWATSAEIPVVSASALVISGQDGDLGTLVNDVPYSISTDTGNQITATITVNGAVIFSGNVGNSTAGVIPVLDLINGAGTIVIEASVTASSGPVSAVRTWTYTKTMMTFPNAGSIAELTKDGNVMWPETLAEAVRIPGGKTLDQVMGFPCQIYTGSYVGTGTFGKDNPNEITFPFEPKAVCIIGKNNSGGVDIYSTDPALIRGSTLAKVYVSTGDSRYTLFVSWNDNSVSWYTNGSSSSQQLNASNYTYYYVAIG